MRDYSWFFVPIEAGRLSVPRVVAPRLTPFTQVGQPEPEGADQVELRPMIEERHGGVKFWFGWDSDVRAASLWIES
jgi:hypothetical protein